MGEVMPLTPEDVSNKRFTPVRLREGYDMGEVDQFLDEVEAELARLTKENDDLRTKLSSAQGASSAAPAATAREPAAWATGAAPPERARGRGAEQKPPEPTARAGGAPPPAETIRVETVPQASNAAARL